jgi:hypothetical protein
MNYKYKKCKCTCECSASDSDEDVCPIIPPKMTLSEEEAFDCIMQVIDKNIPSPITEKTNHISNMLHFKNICNSLNPNDEGHNKIKSVMTILYLARYSITDIYEETLKTIANESITDFTINFPNDKSIKCLKAIIQQIPYFDMMIKDCGITDTIVLDDDYDNVMTIINLLHNIKSFKVEIDNAIDVLLLTDKYLMVDNLGMLITGIENNISPIMNNLKDTNDNDKILSLYKYFNDALKNDDFKRYSNIKTILNHIHRQNLGETMFLIEHWDKKFNVTAIIDVIR